MFDDQNTPQANPPTPGSAPGVAEDIFAPSNLPGVGASDPAPVMPPEPPSAPPATSAPEAPASSPGTPTPAPPSVPMPPPVAPLPVGGAPVGSKPAMPATAPRKRRGFLKTLAILFVALLVIGAAGALAFVIIIRPGMVPADENSTVVDEDMNINEDDTVNEPVVQQPVEEAKTPETVDTDGDGLTDAEEAAAGTSITKMDTDEDGLGDREEVQVYGTDPLDADTDGDTFLDGAEVAGGYNPNGPGKLFEIPK